MNQLPVLLFVLLCTLILILVFFFMATPTHHVTHHQVTHHPHAGDTKLSVVSSDHDGWLLCDGRSVSRSVYKYLFEIIGTSFGSVDSTTFTLPDMRGRVSGVIGQGVNLTYRSLGEKQGEELHTMTVSELVSHAHTGTTDNAGGHTHTGTTVSAGGHTHTGTTASAGGHTHTHNAPGGQGNLGLAIADGTNTVINTDPSQNELNVWTSARALTINSTSDHQHAFTTAAVADHQHAFTTAAVADHHHTFTSQTTGSTTPFNVLQPTLFLGNVFMYAGEASHPRPSATPH